MTAAGTATVTAAAAGTAAVTAAGTAITAARVQLLLDNLTMTASILHSSYIKTHREMRSLVLSRGNALTVFSALPRAPSM